MSAPSQIFYGIGASRGIAIGRVFLLDRRQIKLPRYHISPQQVEHEISRLKDAIDTSYQQLETIRNRFSDSELDHQAILEAHEMMVQDPALFKEAVQLIRNLHYNAEWAVSTVISRLRGILEEVQDSYLKQRRGDIDFIGDRIIRNLTGKMEDVTKLGPLNEGTVIVAHDLSPADTAVLTKKNITAFVTEIGGKTSHSSIIARSMDVPAVVGVHNIFQALCDKDIIAVDGTNGIVELRPSPDKLSVWQKQAVSFAENKLHLLQAKALPAITVDSTRVQIGGNIELPSDAQTVFEHGGESIGLYRTEFLYTESSHEPSEEDHFQAYSRISKLADNKTVTIRTLDLGADKLFNRPENLNPEPNPVLGLRGIRYCLAHVQLFKKQLAGILRAGVNGNLRILVPMLSNISELRETRELIDEVAQELASRGVPHAKNIPLGSMIEVPSAVLGAEQIAQEADFLSIGTNDLIQYLLAIDRTNDRVAYLYQPLQPSVIESIRQVLHAAQKNMKPISICGEMAGEIIHVPVLIGLGFRELSMNAGSIPRIKRLIREISHEDCKALVLAISQLRCAEEIQNLAQEFLENHLEPESHVWTPHYGRLSTTT